MSFDVTFSTSNSSRALDELGEELRDIIEEAVDDVFDGLLDSAVFVLGEAVDRAPLRTGALRGSGYVEVDEQPVAKVRQEIITEEEAEQGKSPGGYTIEMTGQSLERGDIAVVFGAPYAARQHEDMSLNHPLGGEAKFLENAALDNKDRILERVKKAASGGE